MWTYAILKVNHKHFLEIDKSSIEILSYVTYSILWIPCMYYFKDETGYVYGNGSGKESKNAPKPGIVYLINKFLILNH